MRGTQAGDRVPCGGETRSHAGEKAARDRGSSSPTALQPLEQLKPAASVPPPRPTLSEPMVTSKKAAAFL